MIYKTLLDAGNTAQVEQLKNNSGKTGWNNFPIESSMARIKSNLDTINYDPYDNLKKTRKCAADIANFAHMIILTCDKKLKINKKG
ncbi:MAG: hypothetical protein KAR38_15850 [Calditrichia bacterium]|nr:hypothetical protein [Calditrichia bacterium]